MESDGGTSSPRTPRRRPANGQALALAGAAALRRNAAARGSAGKDGIFGGAVPAGGAGRRDAVSAIDGSGWPVQGLGDGFGGAFIELEVGLQSGRDRGLRPLSTACQGNGRMKKSDLIERVAGEAGMTKQAAGSAADGVFAAIADALARGEDVTVVGFGKFSTNSRPARTGRNPRTGEAVAVGPSTTVSFKAGKPLKDALNWRRRPPPAARSPSTRAPEGRCGSMSVSTGRRSG